MADFLLNINPSAEQKRIVSFIKRVFKEQRFENAVIGMSGGIDSATSISLLAKALPPKNIFVAHLYYFDSHIENIKPFLKQVNIPQKNIYNISIKDSVDTFQEALPNEILKQVQNDNRKIRLGNVMARIRMIILYDLAKKHNALVAGTENKSEDLLGYFTRFGDQASDLEPIQHLFKTQVYQLANYLGVPENIINQAPTAGLWTGQTDEKELGFSYKEADMVLKLYFEEKNTLDQILEKGFKNAEKIIERVKRNEFKHKLPYGIKE